MEALRFRSLTAIRVIETLAVIGALGYIAVLGWMMLTTTYDVWGALILIPVIVGVTGFALLKIFEDDPVLFRLAMTGLLVKLGGTFARYWVVFDAYGGLGDSKAYHLAGTEIARAVRGGEQSLLSALPHDVGTKFIEGLTGLLYTLFGGSQLAGFFWFSWLGYWGLVLFVKAAAMGFPDIDLRRYAMLTFLAPTLIFWPSSIGKEAWMMLSLGVLTWAIARGFSAGWGPRTLVVMALGTAGASFVRPHQAAIWLGALVLALLLTAGRANALRGAHDDGPADRQRRAAHRLKVTVMAAIGAVAVVIVGRVTLSYLAGSGDDPSAGITDRIGGLFDENSRRSTGGGSSFTPPSIATPLQWPSAIFQTLFRPFVLRARGLAQLIPAVETNLLLAFGLVSFGRMARLPRTILRNPFVATCFFACVGFGLAFSTFGNLAILVRQRSLIYPLLFVMFSLPIPVVGVRPPLPSDRTWRRPTASVGGGG